MSQIQDYAALVKPKRTGLRRVRAEQLKAPPQPDLDESGGEDHQYGIVYVSDGVEHHVPCTAALWRKVEGPNPRPGRPHPGMDMRTERIHFIYHNRETNRAESLDFMPNHSGYRGGLIPEHLKDIDTVEIKIDQRDGSLEVLSYPPKVAERVILAIFTAIDNAEEIKPGDLLAGRYHVNVVAGNKIEVDPGVE